MFEKFIKWAIPKAVDASGAVATGGLTWYIQAIVYFIQYLPYIILISAIIVLSTINGCQKKTITGLKADIVKLEETVKAKDLEISELNVKLAAAKSDFEKKVGELKIVQDALTAKGQFDKASAELEKKRNDIMEAWQKEEDAKKKAQLEADYWNTILGIKDAKVDEKTNTVKIVPVKITKPVKKVK